MIRMENMSAVHLAKQQSRVLLVEDNRVNQLVVRGLLQRWGFETHIANNGMEAVQMVQFGEYHLILMDLHMPEMDGFEATINIRKMNEHYRPLPIIALTASASRESMEQAGEAGITELLTKPFRPESLYQLISKYLSMQTASQQGPTLVQKVEQIVGADTHYQKTLIQLYIKSFRDILHELNTGQLEDTESLKRTRHKHKTTLVMLELHDFDAAFLNLQQALDCGNAEQAEITAYLDVLRRLIDNIIQELEAIN